MSNEDAIQAACAARFRPAMSPVEQGRASLD
jgi:hypothetical protein